MVFTNLFESPSVTKQRGASYPVRSRPHSHSAVCGVPPIARDQCRLVSSFRRRNIQSRMLLGRGRI